MTLLLFGCWGIATLARFGATPKGGTFCGWRGSHLCRLGHSPGWPGAVGGADLGWWHALLSLLDGRVMRICMHDDALACISIAIEHPRAHQTLFTHNQTPRRQGRGRRRKHGSPAGDRGQARGLCQGMHACVVLNPQQGSVPFASHDALPPTHHTHQHTQALASPTGRDSFLRQASAACEALEDGSSAGGTTRKQGQALLKLAQGCLQQLTAAAGSSQAEAAVATAATAAAGALPPDVQLALYQAASCAAHAVVPRAAEVQPSSASAPSSPSLAGGLERILYHLIARGVELKQVQRWPLRPSPTIG